MAEETKKTFREKVKDKKDWVSQKTNPITEVVFNKPLSGPLNSIAKKLQEADRRVDKLITAVNNNRDSLMTDLAQIITGVKSLGAEPAKAQSKAEIDKLSARVNDKKSEMSNLYDKEMYPYLQNVNSLCGRFIQVTVDLQRAVVDIEKMKPMKEEEVQRRGGLDSSLRIVEAKGPADREALIKEIDNIYKLFNKIKIDYFQSPKKLLDGVNKVLRQLQRWWRNVTKEKNKTQVNFIKKYFGEGQQVAPNGYLDLGSKYYLTTILANLHQVQDSLKDVGKEIKQIQNEEGMNEQLNPNAQPAENFSIDDLPAAQTAAPTTSSISLRRLKRAQRKYRQQILNSITGLIGKNNA